MVSNVSETFAITERHVDASGSIADLPASFCVWLASGESDFLKGRIVWANWDVNEMKAKAEEIVGKDLLTMRLAGWPAQPA